MVKSIDRADWHYGGDYPPGLPPENGGTHIGMYLAWIIHRDLASATLRKFARDALPLLRHRKITGRQLLFAELDEKLFDALLTNVGKHFTRAYYSHIYLEDYATVLGDGLPTVYHVEDSWENYDRLAPVIDQRFCGWQQGELAPPSPIRADLKVAEERYLDAILEAGRELPANPAAAIAVLEAYLSSDPLPPYRSRVLREIERVRGKYGAL